jgi:hypothetical protein
MDFARRAESRSGLGSLEGLKGEVEPGVPPLLTKREESSSLWDSCGVPFAVDELLIMDSGECMLPAVTEIEDICGGAFMEAVRCSNRLVI